MAAVGGAAKIHAQTAASWRSEAGTCVPAAREARFRGAREVLDADGAVQHAQQSGWTGNQRGRGRC